MITSSAEGGKFYRKKKKTVPSVMENRTLDAAFKTFDSVPED